MRKTLAVIAAFTILSAQSSACAVNKDYSWAEQDVQYCRDNGIMTGDENGDLNLSGTLTRAQMAKMLVEGFDLEYNRSTSFDDISAALWYYDYARAIKDYMPKAEGSFKGDEVVSREEFAATLTSAAGYKNYNANNPNILKENFNDSGEVSAPYNKLMCIAVERAFYRGSDYYLHPKDAIARAEVCAILHRVIENKKGALSFTWEDLGVREAYTPILGQAQITQESAMAWAEAHGASELFLDAAQYYWKYGEEFGIRPEIMYAQAAKETGYGTYKGAVKPEMNNFAGIKKYGASGDATDDHETFPTREDGVRGHFNHMSAYVGIAPIGEVHGRYKSVSSIAWAGSIKNVEALGGRWCPDLYYGYSIVHDLLEEMEKY